MPLWSPSAGVAAFDCGTGSFTSLNYLKKTTFLEGLRFQDWVTQKFSDPATLMQKAGE